VRFSVNQGLPPLAAESGSFDFIYGISVFTHLNEDYQRAWLEELWRVARPGGIVLLTVHGTATAGQLPQASQDRLRAEGFVFHETDSTKGLFPDWYQASFQTPAQVRRSFGRNFEVLSHFPQGLDNYQDIVLLTKPSEQKAQA
jgi:SAM-dependent methyltransferase